MGLISVNLFVKITDRLATQYRELKSGIELGSGVGINGPYFDNITGTNDYEIEKRFLDVTYDLDRNYRVSSIIKGERQISALFATMINTLTFHVSSYGYKDISSYCSGVGVKVSRDFAELYSYVTGRTIEESYVEDRETTL